MPNPSDSNNPNNSAPRQGSAITSWLTVGLLAVFGGGLLSAILFEAPVIARLSDPAFTRGLITWIISMSTIGIAFVLIYQAFFSVESSDDRFRRGREIFTGLMGVLGTIVGFYFGSAEKPGGIVQIAEIRFADKQLITHISGGTRPYRYSITSNDKDFAPINNKVSDDGWIIERLLQAPKPGSAVTIDVTDSKDQKASRKLEMPGEGKSPGMTPTQKPEMTPKPPARPPATAPEMSPPTG
jgi:hypothetical protein